MPNIASGGIVKCKIHVVLYCLSHPLLIAQ